MQAQIVLILAPKDDGHAQAVARALDRDFGSEAIVWDPGYFPSTHTLNFRLAEGVEDCRIDISQGRTISVASVRSIWWRRVGPYIIDPGVTDPNIRRFCFNECQALFRGALASLPVPFVNDPEAEGSADRKPLQLATAVKAGLRIPS